MTMIDNKCYSVYTGATRTGGRQELFPKTSVCADEFVPNDVDTKKSDYKKRGIRFYLSFSFSVAKTLCWRI